MKHLPTTLVALVSALLVPALVQADSTTPADIAATKVAEQEFGRLSTDGISAFEDIHLARLAIFDGRIEEAAQFVTDAQASLAKAKTDQSAFVKAESALHPPQHGPAPAPAAAVPDATPVTWIPIDGDLALGETFQATPAKAAAIVSARKGLATGDGAKALRTIKLAAIDVNYTLAVAPLERSIAAVDEANTLFANHDYYNASQALRKAEAGIRYDEIDDVANVSGKISRTSSKAK
jgi:hypothetical protein